MSGDNGRPIGSSQLRREDRRLLTGRGRFVGDVSLPRMLELAFVRSVHAHARLGHIDTETALQVDGVEAVLTASDLHSATLSNQRHPNLLLTEQPVLARDRVRFVGELVGIVLATDRYLAEDAVDLVDVDYDVIEGAGQPLFDHIPDDVVFRDVQTFGDVEEAFTRATTIVSSSLRIPRQLACPLEARGCVASFDASSGEVTVWSATQAPHRLRRDLAGAIGIAENRIRVVMHDIGGGFGQKIPTHLEEVAVVLASMATGRPVKWVEDRQENLVSAPHSRDQDIALELALDDDLRFIGMRAKVRGDSGAYSFNSGSSLTEAYRTARSMPGVYRIGSYSYDVSIKLSNKSPIAPYRGVGFVASQCARELLIDKVARQLSVDRFELRERNMVRREDMPYTSSTGWVLNDASFVETMAGAREKLKAVTEALDAPPEGVLRGIGVSPFVEPSGVGGEGGLQVHGIVSPSHDSARVMVDSSGKATVVVGTPSIGQGLETTMTQVAADALGFAVEDVAVAWGDTTHAPLSLSGTRASRAAVVSGGAVGRAARQVRQQILEVAAELLEADVADLSARDSRIWVVGERDHRLTVPEVVGAGFTRAELRGGVERTFEATKFYDPPASYSNACVVAVVEVSTDTGSARVTNIMAVEDCGTMINPMIVDGQFIGGVAQGIGMALLERFEYSPEGQPLTSTLMEYLQPTAGDTVNVDIDHIATPSSVTWEGMKGMGESGVIGTTAAVAAAVADAIACHGAEVEQLPLLPCTVWTMLGDAKKQSRRRAQRKGPENGR
jgi:CO/xanthine dehydrogenase Mo-binding subunit